MKRRAHQVGGHGERTLGLGLERPQAQVHKKFLLLEQKSMWLCDGPNETRVTVLNHKMVVKVFHVRTLPYIRLLSLRSSLHSMNHEEFSWHILSVVCEYGCTCRNSYAIRYLRVFGTRTNIEQQASNRMSNSLWKFVICAVMWTKLSINAEKKKRKTARKRSAGAADDRNWSKIARPKKTRFRPPRNEWAGWMEPRKPSFIHQRWKFVAFWLQSRHAMRSFVHMLLVGRKSLRNSKRNRLLSWSSAY